MKKQKDLVLFYGSLRKGEYNYNYFKNGLTYIKTLQIPGYKLYSLGSYPGIKKSNNKDNVITVDLFQINNWKIGKSIDLMEKAAGYGVSNISINNQNAKLYVYNGAVGKENLIKSGDWVNR